MPYKDPVMRRRNAERWQKEGIKVGYGRWLYSRRRLRFEDAENFRNVLEEIAAADYGWATSAAKRALGESNKRIEALGPSPRPPKKSERVKDDPDDRSLAAVLANMGLSA